MPTQFMAKSWIFIPQAVTAGFFGLFSLILGPLFLFGIMTDVKGAPAPDAGIALSIMSVPLLLIFALAIYNLRARRRPLLRLCREGIEIVQIGSSSLDRFPLIPGLFRTLWLILSTQGFRKKVICITWNGFQDAWLSGPPMSRQLTIVASQNFGNAEDLPRGSYSVEEVVLGESAFKTPLDQIAEVINSHAKSSMAQSHLPSWHEC